MSPLSNNVTGRFDWAIIFRVDLGERVTTVFHTVVCSSLIDRPNARGHFQAASQLLRLCARQRHVQQRSLQSSKGCRAFLFHEFIIIVIYTHRTPGAFSARPLLKPSEVHRLQYDRCQPGSPTKPPTLERSSTVASQRLSEISEQGRCPGWRHGRGTLTFGWTVSSVCVCCHIQSYSGFDSEWIYFLWHFSCPQFLYLGLRN